MNKTIPDLLISKTGKGGTKMRCYLIAAILVIFCFAATASMANDLPVNELLNSCFEQGGEHWEDNSVGFNTETKELIFDRSHVAYDDTPFTAAGLAPADELVPNGAIRQVVDDSLSPYWNPELNRKLGYLSFWVRTSGDAFVKVGFDWWDSITIDKPGRGEVADHTIILDQEYRSTEDWTQVIIEFDWLGMEGNNQPRWVGINFYFYGCTGTANTAAVDDTFFHSKCTEIPEPSSLLALFGGATGLIGFAVRRRK